MTRFAYLLAATSLCFALPGGAALADDTAEAPAVTAEQAAGAPETWRAVNAEQLFMFETSKGRILIEAFPDIAPKHVQQFTTIIRSGDYDGTVFHRVIDDFMAQGGDIQSAKGRPSGLDNIPGEFTFMRDPSSLSLDAYIGPADNAKFGYLNGFPIAGQPEFFAEMSASGELESYVPHCRGVVSTARTDDINSANSQFFLMREHSPHLDRKYTAWGRVVEGEDIVKAIKHGSRRTNGQVEQPDVLMSARVVADLPADTRPKVWVMRTDTDAFRNDLAQKGEVDICTLPSVPTVVSN